MQETSKRASIEAVLFAAGEPIVIEKLAKFFSSKEPEIQKELSELKDFYNQNGSGLDIIFKGKEVQLVSNKAHAEMIAKFLNKELSEELSTAAAEVLAVVAYRGPITRAQIEQIRGVNCSFTLRNLSMRGLVERKDNPSDSRSYLYEISFDFLKQLGLSKIKELPDYEQLHSSKALSEDNANPEQKKNDVDSATSEEPAKTQETQDGSTK